MLKRVLAAAVFVIAFETPTAMSPAMASQAPSCSDCTAIAAQAEAICETSQGARNPRDCSQVYSDVLAQCTAICGRLP
jgi:hypothetical protein